MKESSGQAPASAGQAVLIVLLVVVVALGLGLSIVSQSTMDVKISKQEQEGSRAFNAAEAGIEEALKNIVVGVGQEIEVDGITVNYDVSGRVKIQGEFEENKSIEVNLEGADLGLNKLTVNWGDISSNCSGATAVSGGTVSSLLISVVDNLNQVTRYGLNACALNSENAMEDITDAGDGYFRKFEVGVDSNDVLVRIRPLYNQTSLMVAGNVDLPNQAYLINSTAQAETLESKAIEVTRTESASSSIFDYALFSGGSIIK
ncbi:MAG: PilX N-terminal domain-containing pilus assembly protein [Patescibacteria group bacterium]|nr:PilX N-terminal domain-containing pilus assembly protein [Patescibacteria group bacterium]